MTLEQFEKLNEAQRHEITLMMVPVIRTEHEGREVSYLKAEDFYIKTVREQDGTVKLSTIPI